MTITKAKRMLKDVATNAEDDDVRALAEAMYELARALDSRLSEILAEANRAARR